MKLGRLPAKRLAGVKNFRDYAPGGVLPEPPVDAHYGHAVLEAGQFNMDGNDTYGDCTIAGLANSVPVWNHEVGGSVPIPSSDQAVTQYFVLEGSPNGAPDPSLDNGLAETDVLQAAVKTGLFNSTVKLAAFGTIEPDASGLISDLTQVKQAVAFYGTCYLGVNLPESAQQQFPNPWTVVEGSPIEGGHCIVATGYDDQYLYCYTWGALVSVAWDWVKTYTEEAHVPIPEEFVVAGHGPIKAEGIAQLQADLASV